MNFADITIAALKATEVVSGVLCEIELPGGVQRVWSGDGELTTLDDRVWLPVSNFGEISDIEGTTATEALGFTVGLKAPGQGHPSIEAFAQAVAASRELDIYGKGVRIYIQLCSVRDWSLIGDPQAIAAGILTQHYDMWRGADIVGVSLQCEHILAPGRVASAAYMTDADQQSRFPGDTACSLTTVLPNRVVRWPLD
jgi:hypothetical protein